MPLSGIPTEPPSEVPVGTPANFLSILRLLGGPLIAGLIVDGRDTAALIVFGIAVLTDLLDGPLARRRGEATPLGALLDHGSDACFVVLGLAALSTRDVVPGWLALVIALAFIQYALDSRALTGRPLRASRLGRINGIAYFVILATPLVRDFVGLDWPGTELVRALGWLLVVSTGISMLDRLIALRISK